MGIYFFYKAYIRAASTIFFFVITGTFGIYGQHTVYMDKTAPTSEIEAIREMVELINQSPAIKLTIDTLTKFSGQGIYITTTERDYYRKAPPQLKNMGEEAIFLKGSKDQVYICANTSSGMQHGIFVYLEKLGFRFYFPDPAWQINPSNASLFFPFEELTEPDFDYRRIFMGFGYGSDKLKDQYLFWERANRMGGALQVHNGHAYYAMLADKKKEFEKHPEYLNKPLINGVKQKKTVFNFSSPGLAQLAYEWLIERFAKLEKLGRTLPMLSLEPFDGPNYCDLPGCKKIGDNASDQIFYFTNEVARKLKRTHPDKKIGLLAYYDHIDIPKYDVEDNVFVTLTSSFNTSAFTTDELIARWKTKVKTMGVYDYMSVYSGSNDLPGRGFAGNYNDVARTIKKYKKLGVTAYQAESTYGWVGKGLSHYIAGRLTWESEADVNKIVDEFFDLCFPETKNFIRPVMDKWNSSFVLTENELYQWFSSLRSAFKICKDPGELKRLYQLALYVNYVKLFREFQGGKSQKQNGPAIQLLSYLSDIMDEGVVASYAAINTLAPPLGKEYAIRNKNAVWRNVKVDYPKNKQAWITAIDSYLPALTRIQNVRNYKTSPLSQKEVKAQSLVPLWKNPHKAMSFRGSMTIIADTKASDSLFIKLKGGRTKKIGKVGLKVYAWNDEMAPNGKPLKEFYFAADGKDNEVSLKVLAPGKYIFVATDDASSGATIYFPSKLKYSVLASESSPLKGSFYNYFYFYVPAGVKSFYIVKSHFVRLIDPQGKQSTYGTSINNLVEIPVGEGKSGWWKAHLQLEQIYFIGIPPLVSRDPESYLYLD
jgi:hypothetical protein